MRSALPVSTSVDCIAKVLLDTHNAKRIVRAGVTKCMAIPAAQTWDGRQTRLLT